MQDIKQNLANAVREARTELGLSQEKLAEILNLDQRTILNIEAGRGNPKFEKLYPLITYLKIPADKIFYPDSNDQKPNLQKLLTLINDCTEQEANDLLPMVRYLLELLRKQDNPGFLIFNYFCLYFFSSLKSYLCNILIITQVRF